MTYKKIESQRFRNENEKYAAFGDENGGRKIRANKVIMTALCQNNGNISVILTDGNSEKLPWIKV